MERLLTMAEVGILKQISLWGRLVKFSHTIFAMPFALSMLVYLHPIYPVSASTIAWIMLALISARSAAMCFNRIIDHEFDARNPRTINRELPQGRVSRLSAIIFLSLNFTVFLLASYRLGSHCLLLAPAVLAILCFYSWTKRFTSYSHLVLGICLALAPGGVWYALTGKFALLPIYLMLGVALWVAGFDILYACQDVDFDRAIGLYSIPSLVGIRRSLAIARYLHVGAVVSLVAFGVAGSLGLPYYLATSLFAALLISQHRLVADRDLTHLNLAFFTRNGQASMIYLVGMTLDRLVL
ncbi:MAG: putative 4-hydroxybenzoate polyprenyltransferase [Bdellovibrionales bacterium]|nr:putative 4-hydroxybenzoate polyprenyltransferase [Bdellovibrionales bacterium]